MIQSERIMVPLALICRQNHGSMWELGFDCLTKNGKIKLKGSIGVLKTQDIGNLITSEHKNLVI